MKEKTEDANAVSEVSIPEMKLRNEVRIWNEKFSKQQPVVWDRLPDIELYMDQVVTFLDRQLILNCRNEEDRIITPSMINNYTKDRVIPRTESKKYSRDHIALLMVVCSLKKVLSMPDLSSLLKDFKVNEDAEVEKFYQLFREVQNFAILETSNIVENELKEADINNEKEVLRSLALRLAVEGQTRCVAAERILSILEKKNEEKR